MIQNLLIRAVGFANLMPSRNGIAPMNNGTSLTNSRFVQRPETGSRIDKRIGHPRSDQVLRCMVVVPNAIKGQRIMGRDPMQGPIRGLRRKRESMAGHQNGSTAGRNVRRSKHQGMEAVQGEAAVQGVVVALGVIAAPGVAVPDCRFL